MLPRHNCRRQLKKKKKEAEKKSVDELALICLVLWPWQSWLQHVAFTLKSKNSPGESVWARKMLCILHIHKFIPLGNVCTLIIIPVGIYVVFLFYGCIRHQYYMA